MGAKGRKPKPTALRVLEGNRGKRPINEREPKPPSNLPPAPDFLDTYAREEWDVQAPVLHQMGTLTQVDGATLAAYCSAYSRFRSSSEDMEKMAAVDAATHGAVIKTQSGNYIQNPLLGILNAARRDVVRFASELGLTPSSRARLETSEPVDDDDLAARKYFGS